MAQQLPSMGLIGSLRRDIVAMIVVAGLVIAGVVYYFLGVILRERFEQQTSLMATNLADSAAGYLVSRDILQLRTLVAKYGRLDGVAYTLIQDREGNVLANSLGPVVPPLEANASNDRLREVGQRRVTFQGKVVYESRASVLEGRLGTVYLGMWADTIQKEIYRGFLLLLGGIAVVVIAAAIGAVVLTGRLIRPFRRLTEIAGRMSTGDLDTPVPVESQKDFGDLTRSLERMRSSLKAAMMRLNQN